MSVTLFIVVARESPNVHVSTVVPSSSVQVVPLQVNSPKSDAAKSSGSISLRSPSCLIIEFIILLLASEGRSALRTPMVTLCLLSTDSTSSISLFVFLKNKVVLQ